MAFLDNPTKQRASSLPFDEYQRLVKQTDRSLDEHRLGYLTLTLSAKLGIIASRVNTLYQSGQFDHKAVMIELSAILYTIALMADELDYPLEHVARVSLDCKQQKGE